MWKHMAVFALLPAVAGCPGNPAEPPESTDHPGLAVVTITGSLSRSDTLRAILPPMPGAILPGGDTLFFFDVLMMRSPVTDSSLLMVSIRVQAPSRYATGVFPISPDHGTFVLDTFPAFTLDPLAPDLTLAATDGEVDITANTDSLLIGHFEFNAADGTGRTIRAVGTFDARPFRIPGSFGPPLARAAGRD